MRRTRRVNGGHDGRLPSAVSQRVGELAPRTRLYPPPRDDGERNERRDADQRLLDERERRIDQEDRDCKQREIERRMEQNRRQKAEAKKNQRPDHRRHDQFNEARIRRKSWIIRVRAAEYQRLQHEGERDAECAAAVAFADQRAERKGNGAKYAFLHEARLQRNRNRRQRRRPRAQNVGIGQHLGRLPPSEPFVRCVIERCDQRELEWNEQIAAGSAPQRLPRGPRVARPQVPQLRLVRECATRQRFSGHECERVTEARRGQQEYERPGLLEPERQRRFGRIGAKPGFGRRGETCECEQSADD